MRGHNQPHGGNVTIVAIAGTNQRIEAGAGACLVRTVAVGMPLKITTAYRSREYQARLYHDWINKVPGANFALPPGKSLHELGLAVDFGRASSDWLEDYGADYGWSRPVGWNGPSIKSPEWWHWEYNVLRDTQLFAQTQEEDMAYTPEQITAMVADGVRIALETDRGQNSVRRIVWELSTVVRDGKPVPAIQELADAKTNAIQANAKADAIIASLKDIPSFDSDALAAKIVKLLPAATGAPATINVVVEATRKAV